MIYIMSNNNLNIYAYDNNKISRHLDLGLRVCSGRTGLPRLFRFTLNLMGFYSKFYDYYTNFYEVTNVYIHVLINLLKLINLDLIFLLNADFFKHQVFYFPMLKMIFGRM